MLIRYAAKIRPSEITPKSVYLNRRALLGGVGGRRRCPPRLPRPAAAAMLDYSKDTTPPERASADAL